MGLSRSTLNGGLDHIVVGRNYPGVYQLHISEVSAEVGPSADIVSSGSEDCVEGAIRVVSFLVPSLLVAEPPSRVEVLEHVFHSIGSQEVCYLAGP